MSAAKRTKAEIELALLDALVRDGGRRWSCFTVALVLEGWFDDTPEPADGNWETRLDELEASLKARQVEMARAKIGAGVAGARAIAMGAKRKGAE